MKKLAIVALINLFAVGAFAQNTHLICMTGDITDMDIKIENVAGKEKLSVILTAMDGETVTNFVNSNVGREISADLAKGEVKAVVSTSDLQDTFGGAYLDAGLLNMKKNKTVGGFDVLFASKGIVIQANCK